MNASEPTLESNYAARRRVFVEKAFGAISCCPTTTYCAQHVKKGLRNTIPPGTLQNIVHTLKTLPAVVEALPIDQLYLLLEAIQETAESGIVTWRGPKSGHEYEQKLRVLLFAEEALSAYPTYDKRM